MIKVDSIRAYDYCLDCGNEEDAREVAIVYRPVGAERGGDGFIRLHLTQRQAEVLLLELDNAIANNRVIHRRKGTIRENRCE